MSETVLEWSYPKRRAARRLASSFGVAFAVLLLAWLLRGLLGIRVYGEQILLAAFGALLIARILRTRTDAGFIRAISSLLWNLAIFAVISVTIIWLLQWAATLQGEILPRLFENQIPNLALAAIALGLSSFAFRQASPRHNLAKVEKKPRLVRSNAKMVLGKVSLTSKSENIAFPIKRFGRDVGNIVFGQVHVQLETPIGPVGMKIKSPYLVYRISLRGVPARDQEVERITGRNTDSLFGEARQLAPQVTTRFRERVEEVDLPFVHVREDEMGSVVDVGPIHIEEGPSGEEFSIGPFTISSEKSVDFPQKWGLVSPANSAMIFSRRGSMWAKWNGISVKLSGDFMKFKSGEEGFEYSPHHIKTRSPLHVLRIGKDHASIFTKNFAIRAILDKLTIRTDGKTKALDSAEIATEVREALAEEARRHIQNIMEELPIELDATFRQLERVLGKHLE